MSNTISVPLSLHIAFIGVSKFDFFCLYPYDCFQGHCASIIGVRRMICGVPWPQLQMFILAIKQPQYCFHSLLIAPPYHPFSSNHFFFFISFLSFQFFILLIITEYNHGILNLIHHSSFLLSLCSISIYTSS